MSKPQFTNQRRKNNILSEHVLLEWIRYVMWVQQRRILIFTFNFPSRQQQQRILFQKL